MLASISILLLAGLSIWHSLEIGSLKNRAKDLEKQLSDHYRLFH